MSKENDLFGNIDLGTLDMDTLIETEEVSTPAPAKSGEDAGANDPISGEEKDSLKVNIGPLDQELLDVGDVPATSAEDTSGEEKIEGTEEDTKGEGTPSADDKGSNSSSSPEIQPFAELGKKLFDDGYLTQFDDEDFNKALSENNGDPMAAFGEMVKKTIEDIHEDWVEQYPPLVQDLIRASQAGIPVDKMYGVKQVQLKLDGITEDIIKEDAEIRKQLLTEHRKATTTLSEEKIKKDVQRIIDSGQDEEEALDAHKELRELAVTKEKELKADAIRQEKLAEEKRVERQESIRKDVYATKEIIPTIPLTKKEQDELFKSMITPVAVGANNRPLTDVDVFFSKYPVEARKALHYYFQKGLFRVDEKTGVFSPDFSKINNVLKTMATKEMKSNAEKSRVYKSGVPGVLEDNGTKPDLGQSISNWLKQK